MKVWDNILRATGNARAETSRYPPGTRCPCVVFVVVTAALALIAMSITATDLQKRAMYRVTHASEMLAQTDFALNPIILENVRSIVDVDIVTYRRDRQVIASTLSASFNQDFLQ